jgi:signal transduction histidine kinase
MKVEITDLLDLTQEQTALIDMHSVVNIMNVLINELDYLQETFQEGEPLQRAADEIQQINHRLHNSADIETELGNLLQCESHVMKLVRAVLDAHPKAANDSDVRGSVSNLQSVFAILDTRGRELLARVHAPEEWTDHDVEQLTKNFTNVLAAIEKNSKGRYRIVHNIAEQEQQDYIVNFSIDSVDGTAIHMPPVLQDVMRDLIANARKYTGPGGEISAGLADNGKELRLVVEDSGRGIPSDEVQQVVEFGKRGSNVDDKATMGGGFGLTKAYLVTRRFGGRMWIDSSPGAGTRITISIPRPAA